MGIPARPVQVRVQVRVLGRCSVLGQECPSYDLLRVLVRLGEESPSYLFVYGAVTL